jgi:hypothetical protein
MMSLKSFLLEKLFQYQKTRGFRPDYIILNRQPGETDDADDGEEQKEKKQKEDG